jgi:hypothetical protein
MKNAAPRPGHVSILRRLLAVGVALRRACENLLGNRVAPEETFRIELFIFGKYSRSQA